MGNLIGDWLDMSPESGLLAALRRVARPDCPCVSLDECEPLEPELIAVLDPAIPACDRLATLWTADRAGRPRPGGPYVALTPLGAWYAGLVLVRARGRLGWRPATRDEHGDPMPRPWTEPGPLRPRLDRPRRLDPIAGVPAEPMPRYLTNEWGTVVMLWGRPIPLDPGHRPIRLRPAAHVGAAR
jgi:hypothetical protein